MPMTVSRFLAQYRTLKDQIEQMEGSEELRRAWERVLAVFRATYTTESLKDALAADDAVPAELEERLTSALVLYNRERTAGASRVAVGELAEP
jgi:hypothetical protein